MTIEVKVTSNVMRVKITGGPELWSLKVVDMATGKILPVSRSFIDLRYTPEGKLVALLELIPTEVDIEANAEIFKPGQIVEAERIIE